MKSIDLYVPLTTTYLREILDHYMARMERYYVDRKEVIDFLARNSMQRRRFFGLLPPINSNPSDDDLHKWAKHHMSMAISRHISERWQAERVEEEVELMLSSTKEDTVYCGPELLKRLLIDFKGPAS